MASQERSEIIVQPLKLRLKARRSSFLSHLAQWLFLFVYWLFEMRWDLAMLSRLGLNPWVQGILLLP